MKRSGVLGSAIGLSEARFDAAKRRANRKGPGRLLPQRLGAYELFDHVGKGGMADIYRARRAVGGDAERIVVVKEVLPELYGVERFRELLIAEAKLAARLEHGNIVRVEHLGEEEGTLFIAMEYVEGLDLRELLRTCAQRRVPLPIELSLRVVIEILKALDFAHRFRLDDDGPPRIGIVHRDVSPSNVLLSFDGEVKLCDFGIARAHDDTAALGGALTEALVEGKAGYMSPEQANGEPLDGRADIFAAGIVLYELMSGKKLYKANPSESLLDVAKRAAIPPLPAHGIPHEDMLQAIVSRALAPRREDRYPTAREMAGDLESFAQRAKITASSLRLGDWLTSEFAEDILRGQKRRERIVDALSRGPLAIVKPISIPKAEITPIESPTPTPTPTGTRKRRKKRRAPISTSIEVTPKRSPWPALIFGLSVLIALIVAFARWS
jgi:eukaryotic-like serine/threonine-protein kinase